MHFCGGAILMRFFQRFARRCHRSSQGQSGIVNHPNSSQFDLEIRNNVSANYFRSFWMDRAIEFHHLVQPMPVNRERVELRNPGVGLHPYKLRLMEVEHTLQLSGVGAYHLWSLAQQSTFNSGWKIRANDSLAHLAQLNFRIVDLATASHTRWIDAMMHDWS